MSEKTNRIKSTGRNDIIRILYLIVFGCLLLILFFFSKVHYVWSGATKAEEIWDKELLSNIILMPVGTVLIFALFRVVNRRNVKNHRKGLFAVFLFLSLALQIYAARQYYMFSGWDPKSVVSAATGFVHGGNSEKKILYLSRFPNNMTLAYLFSILIRIAERIFGPLNIGQVYMVIIAFQCVLNHMTGVLLYSTARSLLGENMAVFSAILYWLLVVCSPWVSIPYSDSVGLIFPVLILYTCMCIKAGKHLWIKWLITGILTGLGYGIKPQAAIVSIAVIMIAVFDFYRKHQIKTTLLPMVKKTIAFVAGMVFCFFLVAQIPRITRTELDPDQKISWTHFLMMGLNEERNGVWDRGDTKMSQKAENQEARMELNIRTAEERVADMGVAGLAKHLVRKTLAVFNDGTFAWNGEGQFYEQLTEPKDETAARILRKIYYPSEEGGRYNLLWCHAEQIIWLGILFWCFIAGLGAGHRPERIIMLSLTGLTLFELLFEARARYLYIYTPFFILMAAYGLNFILKKQQDRKKLRA